MDAAISGAALQPIRAFCKQESICLATFYNLRKRSLQEGKGDPIRKLGRLSRVYPEVAKAWLRSMTTPAA